MSDALRVVALPGSLRRASLNRRLLLEAQRLAPDGMVVEIFDLGGIPLFDQDVEQQGDPPRVVELKEAIRDADAVLLGCPEYNHSITGVLKNAIDWASRPPGKTHLSGKPVALVGATPGRGATLRAQAVVRQSLHPLRCWVLPGHEIALAGAGGLFEDDGRIGDEKTAEALEKMLAALARWIEKVRGLTA
ncbi:MAG TPA: NAD(P)H-dependent oxidoreductase [Thermoanaerobaculia bacterium]|nr:NAD(P)H-dependent oxidoreductase [Thermoanaerobaculia bacterium]